MADTKLTALTAITAPTSDDLLYIVDDAAGTPQSRKVTVGNLLGNYSPVWNDAGTTFSAVKVNVTDTASNAASLLMDLQLGGTSFYKFGKGQYTNSHGLIIGDATVGGGVSFRYLTFDTAWGDVDFTNWGGQLSITGPGLLNFTVNGAGYFTTQIGLGGNKDTSDLRLYRDAANTLAQRNGTNAQAFNLYNTYTDASNYERGVLGWNSNEFVIGTEKAGTGSIRIISISGAAQVDIKPFGSSAARFSSNGMNLYSGRHLLWITDISADIGADGASRPRNIFLGNYLQLSEMTAPAAPSANDARIYVEDNGSGKSRLMVKFGSGAAQQIAIEP